MEITRGQPPRNFYFMKGADCYMLNLITCRMGSELVCNRDHIVQYAKTKCGSDINKRWVTTIYIGKSPEIANIVQILLLCIMAKIDMILFEFICSDDHELAMHNRIKISCAISLSGLTDSGYHEMKPSNVDFRKIVYIRKDDK